LATVPYDVGPFRPDVFHRIAAHDHVGVRTKFAAALLLALAWLTFSIWVSQPWLSDLGALTHPIFADVALTFIAYVPGFMNAFLLCSLILDRRPERCPPARYPGVTILIAAYQEQGEIGSTLESLARLDYPGEVEIIALNDGSTDGTAAEVRDYWGQLALQPRVTARLLDFPVNRGKAAVLNDGLAVARHELIVTIDADSRLLPDSLTAIVERLLSDPAGTAAVAGAVLVGNSKATSIAGAQQWDYFLGIAAVKRMQSMYHGTLVAQGAFAIYWRDAVNAVGGWPDMVGEDIVLTWAMLRRGWRVGYAEDAVVFTDAPTTLAQFAFQRKRWARGMVEALHQHERLLFKRRLSTKFIWWNLLFMPMDMVFTFIFIPGLVLALFGFYWIAGPITLLVLPLAALWNLIVFRIQNRMLKRRGIEMARSHVGFLLYLFLYPLVMQPVSLWGYAAELTGRRKEWGTK